MVHDVDSVVTDPSRQSSDAVTASTGVLSSPTPTQSSEECERGLALTESRDYFGHRQLSVDTTPVTSPPVVRPKPVKSPPARPPPITGVEVFPSKKPAADGAMLTSDSHVEFPATSPQPDVPPKSRTLDRVRPEKPPPPLPKTMRSQLSQPAPDVQVGADNSGDVTDDIATHDENTKL